MIARAALRRISSTNKLLNRSVIPISSQLINIFQVNNLKEAPLGNSFSTSNFLRCDSQNDIHKKIDQMVKDGTVVVFMKGVPSAPRCGFSNAVCQIFRMHDVVFEAHDVLQDEEIRQGIIIFRENDFNFKRLHIVKERLVEVFVAFLKNI